MIFNNKILHILQHAPLDTPVSQLYATFHTLPLPDLHNLQIINLDIILYIIRKNYPAFSLAISPKITCFTPIIQVPKTAFTMKFTEAPWDKDLLDIKVVYYGTPSPVNSRIS